MKIRKAVCYSINLGSQDAIAYLRLIAPLKQAGVQIINGIENGQPVAKLVLNGDIVVIQRDFPRRLDDYQEVIKIAMQERKPVVFDVDDLLFFPPDNNEDKATQYYAPSLLPIFQVPMFQALMEADLVTVSAPKLKSILSRYCHNIIVLPTFFDDTLWKLRSPILKLRNEILTIGYMGGNSHTQDIEYVMPVLLDLIKRYPHKLRFHFWGTKPPAEMLHLPQVELTPNYFYLYRDFSSFFQTQSADIFIAPLVDNLQNRCKSPLKFFELSALGAPGVFSHLETYSEVVSHGNNGLLASSLDEWSDCLTQLIENDDLRFQLATSAQSTIRKNWLLSQNAFYWEDTFKRAFEIMNSKREQDTPIVSIARSINLQSFKAFSEKDQSIQVLSAQLAEITSSTAWRIIQLFWRFRIFLAPHGSRRERFVRILMQYLLPSRKRSPLPGFNMSHYEKWIAANEPSHSDLKAQTAFTKDFGYKPLMSIIMPVWNTPKEILNQTILSLLQQTYRNWELCIVDANSVSDTRQVLTDWCKKDRRLKIKFLDENKGIAINSNEALTLANGEFVGFLDHDDLLAPFALFEVVRRLQFEADIDVIYSDEDKIDENGKRFDPFFKPDFSPDYLRSLNFISHFLVIRKPLGEQVGWFREGFDGAQDYDLILRIVEKTKRVIHIPKVLYHWRAWTNSTASGTGAKPYANTSGKKALQEHLNRIGLLAQVGDGYSSTLYREHYQLSSNPLISIIIPSNDHSADLECCIESILQKTIYSNFEIILVENGSKQSETFKLYGKLEQDSRIHILKWDEPFNYSTLNNWAARRVNGEVILFLNNDTQVINGDWLEEMLQLAIRPDIGAVGAKLYYPDDSIQHAGVIVGLGGIAGHSHKHYPRQHVGYFHRLVCVQNISAVTAACMMVRKKVFEEVNGFDENFILAFGDVDLCLRILQKGYLNVWTPYAELYHHESKTRGFEDDAMKQKRFIEEKNHFKQRWNDFLQKGDPYYNPNMTLEREDFSIETRKNVHPT